MSELNHVFDRARAEKRLAFIPYFTAGFPTIEACLENIAIAARVGADAIEIGFPFSDPTADGPLIQASSHEALLAGFKTHVFLDALKARRPPCPLIAMSYVNPLLAHGPRIFERFHDSGLATLVVPDLSLEHSRLFSNFASAARVDVALLASPTTSDERLRAIDFCTHGFLYVVGVNGVTGPRRDLASSVVLTARRARALAKKPIVVGFGLSAPAHLEALRGIADGAIVGSRLVEAIRSGEDLDNLLRSFLYACRHHTQKD